MPKNTACPGAPWVSDPITDQEIAFAHLIMSGTINLVSLNRVPAATDYVFDAVLDNPSSHWLSFAPETGFSGQCRWRL